MRPSFWLLCACALGVTPLVGCSDESTAAAGGAGGTGGTAGMSGTGGGGSAATGAVRVAFIGASITEPVGTPAMPVNYPEHLESLLGDDFELGNFGFGGATMLRTGDIPYGVLPEYAEAKALLPHVVTIILGTNDTKPQHWDAARYEADYRDMIEEMQALSSVPTILLLRPVPVFGENRFMIRGDVLRDEVLPIIDRLGAEHDLDVVDLYSALLEHGDLFPDAVHPTAEGGRLIAEELVSPIVDAATARGFMLDSCSGVACTDTECKIDGVCDAGDGMCDYTAVADGTACTDGECLDGVCAPEGAFSCTEQGIREAIAEGGGPHFFACDGPTMIVTEAMIVIDNHVQLDGGGNISLESEGHPLLHVTEGAEAALSGIALRGGEPIENRGSLRLVNVRMSRVGNPKRWGSIQSYGQLTVVDSEFQESNAVNGAIVVRDGEGTLMSSTVDGIVVLGHALIIDSLVVEELYVSGEGEPVPGEADVVNSTLGLVTNYAGRITIVSSTLTPGRTYIDAVPAIRGNGQTSIRGSVIIGHCDPGVVSDGYNIESPGNTCGFDQATDQVNVSADDVKLRPLLHDNGGPTMTHALRPGSVAVDRIPAEECLDADGEPLTTDQRGEPRPETGGAMCDVGAFEAQGGSL